MLRAAILAMACALLLAGAANSAENEACAQQPHGVSVRGNLPWAYYPGYGCGPVPPAQTKFS
jgi:hypothetical protein